MSRARDRTTLHAVADDLPQAIEDLQTDWGHENRQHWITETPATIGAEKRQPVRDLAAHQERLRQERAELEALTPPDPTSDLHHTRDRIRALQQQLHDLPYGIGRWHGTNVGQAARARTLAATQRSQADECATSSGSIRSRHHWRKTAHHLATVETEATQRYDQIAAPIQEQLETDLSATQTHLSGLEHDAAARDLWFQEHPDLAQRIAAIDRELDLIPVIQRLTALQIQQPGHDRGIGLEL